MFTDKEFNEFVAAQAKIHEEASNKILENCKEKHSSICAKDENCETNFIMLVLDEMKRRIVENAKVDDRIKRRLN